MDEECRPWSDNTDTQADLLYADRYIIMSEYVPSQTDNDLHVRCLLT